MPQAIPIIAATLVQSTIAKIAVAIVASIALSFVQKALAPKPKKPEPGNLGVGRAAQDRTIAIRQAITTWKRAYGIVRLSGAQTFIHTTGTDKEYLHMVLTLLGHPSRAMQAFMLDDEIVPLDADGNATGKYAGVVYARFGTGTPAGDANFNAALRSECPDKWTTSHLQTGRTKLYVRFKYDTDKFPANLPNPSAIVETCNTIEDPRQAGSPTQFYFTDNWALCFAHYLRTPDIDGGVGAAVDEIDEDLLIAAANICDEMVARNPAGVTFTADAATDLLTLADKSAGLRLGNRAAVSSTGTLPAGLAAGVDYFWIPTGYLTGKLATSLANARAGTAIDLTDAGSGTHTVTVNAEPRYTMNGVFDTQDEPREIIADMLTAAAARVVPPGNAWRIFVGAWRPAAEELDKGYLDGGITVQARRSRKELANGYKGVFVNPDDNYQPTDYPVVQRATYVAEDNGEAIFRDYPLSWTNSASMAQRVARIELERLRRQIVTRWPCTLRAMRIAAMTTVAVSNDLWGWDGKTFECTDISFLTKESEGEGGGEDEAPHYGLDIVLNEIDASVFAWDETVDEGTLTPAPTTTLPNPFLVAAPTDLSLESGTAQLFTRADGTIFSRIRVSWTPPADIFVKSGGRIEVQYRKTSGSPEFDFQPSQYVDGGQSELYLLDVEDGASYDVRIRGVNRAGVSSDWVSDSHTVVGKTAAPSDVSGFSAQQNGNVVTFKWDQVADLDLAGYDLRYMAAPFVWDNAQVLTSVTRGTLVTNAGLPPGAWVVGVKARDTSENYSDIPATFAITVTNSNDVVYQREEAPRWAGTMIDLLRHDVSGTLIPESTKPANQHTREELFERFVPYPVAEAFFEAAVIDVGFDADNLRVYAEMAAQLGRGETTGVADPQLQIDYRDAADPFTGYRNWTIGSVNGRYVATRAKLVSASGKAALSAFKPIVDVEESTLNLGNQSIAIGGTRIAFSPQFHSTPSLGLSVQIGVGDAARFFTHEDLDATGVTIRIWDAGGNDVGGTISGTATGPR